MGKDRKGGERRKDKWETIDRRGRVDGKRGRRGNGRKKKGKMSGEG